jgi:glycosyltransferase involved in cell wall biosynthesis
VIPSGVDLDRFSSEPPACGLREELGMPSDGLLIGVVARLEAEKGHRFLIDAMPRILKAVPQAWLAIVGEGSLVEELKAQAASLPGPATERIVFTGRREDVSALTADLDVAALPSLREAQGISLLEAMARRRAVVASDVGGIPEVITHSREGLLVPPGDPDALADAVVSVLRDPALRQRLGDAGYWTVVERFSIDAQVRRTEDLYDEELARAGVLAQASAEPLPSAPPGARAALEVPPG